MTRFLWKSAPAVCLGWAALLLGGCPPTLEPPASAILAGDWFASLGDDEEAVFTFDESGVLTRITAQGTDGPTVEYAVSGATSELSGEQVTIQVPLGDNSTSTFVGTLATDQRKLDGTLSQKIDVNGALTITIPGGELSLKRTEDCNVNGQYDHRELAAGTAADCNENDIPDECDIAGGGSADSNQNGIPDECENE